MNDPELELENELRRLQPAEPSSALAEQIGHRLLARSGHGRAAPARWSLRLAWSLAATASIAAILAWWPAAVRPESARASAEPVVSNPQLVPIGLTKQLYDARDEGLVVLEDGQAMRKLRIRYVDTMEFADRATEASLEISRPSEEIRLVPVRFD